MTLSCSSFPMPPVPADRATWLPVICPVCHTVARAVPAGREAMAFACLSCGDYCLSRAGQAVFDAQPRSTDRALLSEVLQDTCQVAACDWPLVDGLTAASLAAMVRLPPPFCLPRRCEGIGLAAG